jgi:hypothetical protein
MRPFVVLIGFAALVVAACGSNPPASPSPSPNSSSAPSQAVAASPSTAGGTTFNVKLPAVNGHRVRVVVHDPQGVLGAVRAPTTAEAKAATRAFHGGNASVTGGKSAKLLVVGWVGGTCDKTVDLTIQGTQVTVAPAPVAACRSAGERRSVTLKFLKAIDPEAMSATFIAPAAQP